MYVCVGVRAKKRLSSRMFAGDPGAWFLIGVIHAQLRIWVATKKIHFWLAVFEIAEFKMITIILRDK